MFPYEATKCCFDARNCGWNTAKSGPHPFSFQWNLTPDHVCLLNCGCHSAKSGPHPFNFQWNLTPDHVCLLKEWSYLRGGLSTLDRDYGIFNNIHHDIGTHVLHHLFPQAILPSF